MASPTEISAARRRCRYGKATDSDRVLLAEDTPGNPCTRLGPVEHCRCPKHPRYSYTCRSFWEAPAWYAAMLAEVGRSDEPALSDLDLLQQTGEVERVSSCKRCLAEDATNDAAEF